MNIERIWACECGTETRCTGEDQSLGAVFQCPGCKVVWGCDPRAVARPGFASPSEMWTSTT
jgi:hypothetical protein